MTKFDKFSYEDIVINVKELKEMLNQFEDSDVIRFYGGNDGSGGEFCAVLIGESKEDIY